MLTWKFGAVLGLVASAVISVAAIKGSGYDSLQNPSFEKGFASWSGVDRFKEELSIAPKGGRTGDRCLRITMRSTSIMAPGVHQRVTNLEPGATYRLSAWVRSVSGKEGTTVKLKMEFYNTRGENTSIHPVVASVEGRWKPMAVKVPADGELVDLIVTVAGAGAADIDDLRFEKIAAKPELRMTAVAPLAVEADSRTAVLLKASFRNPSDEGSRRHFVISIDGKPMAEPPRVRKIDPYQEILAVTLPPLAPGTRRIEVACGSMKAAEAVKVEVAPRDRKPAFLGDAGAHQRGKRLFFPIGIYNVEHTEAEYSRLAAHGFNMIQGKFPADPDDFVRSLDLALEHGIAVDVPLYAGGRVEGNLQRSLELLRLAGRHPAVLCWKIIDEPDADQNIATRDEVPRVYAALKAARPLQPIELTLCQEPSFGYWARFCDLVQVDRYPLPGGSVSEVYDFCVKAREAMLPWQHLTFVLQCGWTRDLKTQPSVAQARAMVYLALIGGARGISWYSKREKDWDLEATPLWPRLAAINAEVRALAMPLLRGKEAAVRCDIPTVRLCGRLHEGRLYLLVCNPERGRAEVSITLPPAPVNMEWGTPRAMGDPLRKWALEDGVVRFALDPVESLTILVDLEGGGGR